jgi:hypothetical protein
MARDGASERLRTPCGLLADSLLTRDPCHAFQVRRCSTANGIRSVSSSNIPSPRPHRPLNTPADASGGVVVGRADADSGWSQWVSATLLDSRYLPRTLDFRTLTQDDFDAIADQLNGRPRQTLGFKTPSQALAEALR